MEGRLSNRIIIIIIIINRKTAKSKSARFLFRMCVMLWLFQNVMTALKRDGYISVEQSLELFFFFYTSILALFGSQKIASIEGLPVLCIY